MEFPDRVQVKEKHYSVCRNCKYALHLYQASKIICESKIQHHHSYFVRKYVANYQSDFK